MISSRLWKLSGIGLLALAVGAGILTAGAEVPLRGAEFGPGFVRLFDLASGDAVRYYNSLLMLLSGQLALLICWMIPG